jgi:hypothetical protein
MDITAERVEVLAPDASSLSAGRKLAGPAPWKLLGRSASALWGECQGSALYQVRVDLSDLTSACSCPSRKFPCKHALGLLLLAANDPGRVPVSEPPDWISAWLAKREAATTRRESTAEAPAQPKPERSTSGKRADKRQTLVAAGVEGLNVWLADLVRNGLAGLELQPGSFWEKQAARLVDAQAPGLAARVRALATLPGSSPRWPEQLLAQLGKLALLTEAYSRLESLDPPLQADVRSLIGWTLKEDEVVAHGDLTPDIWVAHGQWIEDQDRLRVQRTWLHGVRSGRAALVLQFAPSHQRFASTLAPGEIWDATLAFWPSAYPQRALIHSRHTTAPLGKGLPGITRIEAFLAGFSAALARQPWLDRFPCLLREVVPVPSREGAWRIRDAEGAALPLLPGDHWLLAALSGGHPLDLSAEWNGKALRPLGVVANARFFRLWEAA